MSANQPQEPRQQRVAGVRVEERRRSPGSRPAGPPGSAPRRAKATTSGGHDEPHAAATPAGAGLRGAVSHSASRTSDQRSVRCSRRDEHDDEDELPDQPRGQARQDRLRQLARAVEAVGEPGRDDPGQERHRQRGCRPDGRRSAPQRVLRQLGRRLDRCRGVVRRDAGRACGDWHAATLWAHRRAVVGKAAIRARDLPTIPSSDLGRRRRGGSLEYVHRVSQLGSPGARVLDSTP